MSQKNVHIILKFMLHWYDTTQRICNTPLWIKNAAGHSFNTQFYQKYVFIDLMCGTGIKFIRTQIILIQPFNPHTHTHTHTHNIYIYIYIYTYTYIYSVRINYRKILQNNIFQILDRNTWCYYHLKEECLQLHSDLICTGCAPHEWHGRCPGDTPIPAKPSKARLVWRSRLRCWGALALLVVSLEVVGRKHCLWRNPTGRNHTLSGLVTEVTRCRRCCLFPLQDQHIDLAGVHLGTPGPLYANVVEFRLVGKCTPVPPHARIVVLTRLSACPGTRSHEHCPLRRWMARTQVFWKWHKTRSLWNCHVPSRSGREDSGIPISGIVPVDLSGYKSRFIIKNDPLGQTLIRFHPAQQVLTKRQPLGWNIRLEFFYQLQFLRVQLQSFL